jgi:adenine-specific DNA-methyltransferase
MTNPANAIIHADCVEAMQLLDAGSIGFILTDPPYLVNYRDRSGRGIANDRDADWLKPAFAQMHRALRRNAFCVSFYGYTKIDLFMDAWKSAGFRVAGHLVFPKKYASNSWHTQYRHEQAYLLAKGWPDKPARPPPDVIHWTYTGNKLHPTQKPVGILKPLVEAFSRPGDTILDPFCGSGSTLLAARELDRMYVGIELDPVYFRTAADRLAGPKPICVSSA